VAQIIKQTKILPVIAAALQHHTSTGNDQRLQLKLIGYLLAR